MTDDTKLVLLVDPHHEFAAQARPRLHPHRVLVVHDLEEAFEVVLGGRVDAVFLGPSLASDLPIAAAGRLRRADAGLPVILCSDVLTNRLLRAALRAGLTDVTDEPPSREAVEHYTAAGPEVRIVVEDAAASAGEPAAVVTSFFAEPAVERQAGLEPVVTAAGEFTATVDPQATLPFPDLGGMDRRRAAGG